ncbi:hypothetical protein GJAV_G00110650 [Gymnothorax javanicus]|nr:hypothetical protein GJAV_G00110650 [Gymnothorax javanicus]
MGSAKYLLLFSLAVILVVHGDDSLEVRSLENPVKTSEEKELPSPEHLYIGFIDKKCYSLIMTGVRSALSFAQTKELRSLFGHVKLSLLYKASVHGYTAEAFHNKCDNQGPTVVVAYNQSGFVFGAYTSKNYAQTEAVIADQEAFLFSFNRGKNNSEQGLRRIKPKSHDQAFTDGEEGPDFGALKFLNEDEAEVASDPGNLYDFEGQSVHGDDLGLKECEVYRVEDLGGILERPWRKVQWTAEKKTELMEFVESYKPMMNGVQQARILLVGPFGVGKSSFFNSINSVFRGHVTSQAIAGSTVKSLTTQFRSYQIKAGREGKHLPFIMCDTMGLEEGQGEGVHLDDITSILRGHVVDRYQFNPSVPLQSDSLGYRKNPTLKDMVHCVVYVMDASRFKMMKPKLVEKLVNIRSKANLLGVPQLVLMTKVDEACQHAAMDLKDVYHSHYLEKKLQELGLLMGIPVSCIIPVKNYSQELDLDLPSDILLLSAIQQMLRYADNYFDDISQGEEEESLA